MIHPLIGNNLKEHTEYATWMGEQQVLNLDLLK